MVQWLKSLWYARKKKKQEFRLLEYNRAKLNTELENLSKRLYDFKDEISWQIMREVIELARNVQLLEVTLYCKDTERLAESRGRLQAFNDLSAYIAMAIHAGEQAAKLGKDQEKMGTIKFAKVRKTTNQAGSAI